MTSQTIIGANDLPPVVGAQADQPLARLDAAQGERVFTIRAADSHGHRSSANILIKRRYAWRGYQVASLPIDQMVNRITLTATDHQETVGTITVGLDSDQGLFVEDVFADEVAALRDDGRRLCEFTKLAMDPITGAKRVLASLFHVAYIVAHLVRGCDTLLIEVNPRHVAYYRRMLGCTVLGPQRLNRRVNAPAVLLHLDFHHTHDQIARFGGQPELAASERSLYPFAFSAGEEAGIMSRLRQRRWTLPAA